jgi:G protein beta subunit-like protein
MAGQNARIPQAENSKAAEVILATAGYDHTIRFWEALSGVCIRTIQHPDSVRNLDTD